MIPGAVILGLVVAVVSSAATGVPGELPGLALGSGVLLVAERAFALFAIWLALVIVVVRSFSDQLPVEISGRGVRYADAQSVRDKAGGTQQVLQEMDSDIRWLRDVVRGLLDDEAVGRGRREDSNHLD